MNTRFAAVLAATVLSALAMPSFADHAAVENTEKVISLKDGGTLYVFKDGKMAQENKYGQAVYLKDGQILETTDGQKITANSNEVARLDYLLRKGHRNSN